MSAQDRTLDHYQELMTINATAHVLRSGRELGVFAQLTEGQQTLEQLSEALHVPLDRLTLLMQSLGAIGIIERYGEDYALSSTARLLCQYDHDLGDATWQQLTRSLRAPDVDPGDSTPLPRERFDWIAATQWVHTPAAMQAAEILHTTEQPGGGENGVKTMLDWGCGSAVWSSAIAHRDPEIHVTAIDSAAALTSARTTASSVGLTDRFETREGDLLDASLEAGHYDYVLLAQQLHSLVPGQIDGVLDRAVASLRAGGRLVVIDSFSAKHQPTLAESLEALRLTIQTTAAAVPNIVVAEARLRRAGLDPVQFTYIAASRIGLGMMVGVKP